ncbi:thioredoxin-like protein [Myxozyma melibiosi]|uniref:Thioredoxin-like protein n=1 Tax=Myxozyma melibiosi TaxID=54550 RepID=A0ABR1FC61_9ASCO
MRLQLLLVALFAFLALVLAIPVDEPAAKSTAAKDPTVDLDSTTFKSSIAKGTWWVKHFSPYCPHCKALAPIWSQAAEELAADANTADFHFANVDCVAQGDLCDQNDVTAYPTLILYRDGVLVERYPVRGSKTLEGLKSYALSQFKAGGSAGGAESEDTIEDAAVGVVKGASVVKETTESKGTKDADAKLDAAAVPATPATGDVADDGEDDGDEKTATETPAVPVEKTDEEKASELAAEAAAVVVPPAGSTPNPKGVSVPLTLTSFNKLVSSTRDGYFIKFYVPWCGHCQAMEPAWNELARQMQGKLNIAEVNCEDEKRLCKDARLRGYPSLMFFIGQDRVEYDGLRGVGDLVAFANKAMGAHVRSVDATEFEEIEKKEEVVFLYFYDENTAKEDFDALNRVALPLIGHAPIYTTSSSILASRFRVTTFPRLVAISDGRPSYYTALSPKDMRDHLKVLAWMKTVWLPLLPELSASNSHEIMHGRLVVLGILDKSNEADFERSKKELKAAATEWIDYRVGAEKAERQNQRELKEMKIEEANDKGDKKALKEAQNMHIVLSPRKEVGFAWVDGMFWERWLKKTYGIDVRETGQRVIINDEDNKIYYDQTADGSVITPSSKTVVLDTLKTVIENKNKIKPKSTTGKFVNFVNASKSVIHGYPFALLSFVVGIMLTIAWWFKSKIRRSSRGLSTAGYGIPTSVGGKFD